MVVSIYDLVKFQKVLGSGFTMVKVHFVGACLLKFFFEVLFSLFVGSIV